LGGQFAQDVGDVFAAGGQWFATVEFDGEWTPLEELGDPAHLASVDPRSAWGLLAFLVAVQAVDVAGLTA
jgi:hypothetical protein